MHPQVIQDHPGNCPICGMKLTPIRKQAAGDASSAAGERKIKYYKSTMNPGETSSDPGQGQHGHGHGAGVRDEAAADSSAIAIDPVTMQNMNIRTTRDHARSAAPDRFARSARLITTKRRWRM